MSTNQFKITTDFRVFGSAIHKKTIPPDTFIERDKTRFIKMSI
jgi:hypothetical protein